MSVNKIKDRSHSIILIDVQNQLRLNNFIVIKGIQKLRKE